jgi:DHA3 family macrolide efflux protein-like MFS transporter
MMSQMRQQQTRWGIPFFTIWGGQQLSLIGSNVAQFALVWWVTQKTGSATVLATATLVSLLPSVLLGPLVGALVDRWNRRVVMMVADSLIALASAWLAYLFWMDAMRIEAIYVVMLVRAIGTAFHFPTMQASTSLMVPQEHLPRVAGLNQMMSGAMNVIGPPLGALLLNLLPLHAIMAIDVATAGFAIVPLFFITIPQPQRTEASSGIAGVWNDVREGFRYIRGWPGLLAICGMAMVLNFLTNPVFVLTPILVTDHFGGGAFQLGWLNSAGGIGMIAGGVILSVWGGFRRRIVTGLMGIAGSGLGVILIGLTPATAFPLAVGGMFFGMALNAICNGVLFALLQELVAPEMQGRVFTVVVSLCTAMAPLGMAVAGPAADALGVNSLYVIAGTGTLLLGAGAFFVPMIMQLEDNHRAPKTVEQSPSVAS